MPNYTSETEHIQVLSQADFATQLADFRKKYKLSLADITNLCNGAKFTSKSSLHRVQHGTSQPKYFVETCQILNSYLTDWMEDRKFPVSEIEETLFKLFPFRNNNNMIQNRCELTAPAIKFFGLNNDPFDVDRVPTDEEMFSDPELDDIASRVCDAVLYKRFVAVVGAVGTGKTSMKIRVARKLAQSQQRVHLLYPEFFDMNGVQVGSIASYILDEFEIKPPQSATIRVRRIKELLTSLERDDVRVALVFDECHRLNEKVLASLKNFWEMTNGAYSRLMGVVLFGQPKFVESTLREKRFREIAERVQVLEMPSIEKSARSYLTHKLMTSGGDINKLFDPRAIDRICSVAKTPLSLGNLANAALMEAFKLEETQVESGMLTMLNLPDSPQVLGVRRAA